MIESAPGKTGPAAHAIRRRFIQESHDKSKPWLTRTLCANFSDQLSQEPHMTDSCAPVKCNFPWPAQFPVFSYTKI